MGHRLFGGSGLQRTSGGTKRVMDPCRPISASRKVEGQLGELVHTHGGLVLILNFKYMADEFMNPAAARGAHLRVEALADFVVVEEESPLWTGSNEPCSRCF